MVLGGGVMVVIGDGDSGLGRDGGDGERLIGEHLSVLFTICLRRAWRVMGGGERRVVFGGGVVNVVGGGVRGWGCVRGGGSGDWCLKRRRLRSYNFCFSIDMRVFVGDWAVGEVCRVGEQRAIEWDEVVGDWSVIVEVGGGLGGIGGRCGGFLLRI